jgi:peptidoglycan/LPS O-acetylase OafA/YrhL
LCALPRAIFFIPGVLVALIERYAPLPNPLPRMRGEGAGTPLPRMRGQEARTPLPALRGRGRASARERGDWRRWARFPIVSFVVLLGCWRLVDVDKAHPWAYSVVATFSGMNALYALVALLAGLHLFVCVAHGSRGRWLSSAPLQFLGTISYSFYLWHPIAMFPVKRIAASLVLDSYGRGVTTVVFAIVSLIVAAAVSFASYQVFEVRLAKAIRTWVAARPKRNSECAPRLA